MRNASTTAGRSKLVIAATAMIVAVAGCVDISGGGWIPSINEGYKATFGFNSLCTDTPGGAVLSGDIQYVDHGVIIPNAKGKGNHPMAIHMSLDQFYGGIPPLANATCLELDQELWGTLLTPGQDGRVVGYCPQPPDGECGTAFVVVLDTGNNGPTKGDMFAIELTDGPFGGYINIGALGGGNIAVGTP
jgi:hypothetical protein